MAIILPGGFNITNNEPSDSRFSVANASARYGLSAANIYEGLTVYEQDTDRYYVLFDTSNVGNASGWKEISTGNSFSGSSVIGSDLLNFHSITGSVNITGSLDLNFEGVGKYFAISVNGEEKVKVNNEGVFQLFSQSIAPTAVEGGIYFGNDYNLYLGVNQ